MGAFKVTIKEKFTDRPIVTNIHGVETEEEVNLLRGWGIDMVQGFYFSKPVNSEEIYRICCQNVKK